MREAIARGGIWFFGTIIFLVVFMNDSLEGYSFTEQVLFLFFCGLVVGGVVFCMEWRELETRARMLRERESAPDKQNDVT